jgi:hypothetical protein
VVDFDPSSSRHFDHGYAVTSHSSQGLTADRVLVNIDTASHLDLINSRLAYVSVSRAVLHKLAAIYRNGCAFANTCGQNTHDGQATQRLARSSFGFQGIEEDFALLVCAILTS